MGFLILSLPEIDGIYGLQDVSQVDGAGPTRSPNRLAWDACWGGAVALQPCEHLALLSKHN